MRDDEKEEENTFPSLLNGFSRGSLWKGGKGKRKGGGVECGQQQLAGERGEWDTYFGEKKEKRGVILASKSSGTSFRNEKKGKGKKAWSL